MNIESGFASSESFDPKVENFVDFTAQENEALETEFKRAEGASDAFEAFAVAQLFAAANEQAARIIDLKEAA